VKFKPDIKIVRVQILSIFQNPADLLIPAQAPQTAGYPELNPGRRGGILYQ
jgi:hypothetical protein